MREHRHTTIVETRPRSTVWAGYGARAWAFLFAAMSFYWAAGGTAGAETLGNVITKPALARDPVFVAILWITAFLKVFAGLLALALVRPRDRHIPHWMLLITAWGAGAFLALYGGANLAVRGLMGIGVISTPASMNSTAGRWHLLWWDPWWLLGGILFLVAARSHSLSTSDRRAGIE